MAGHGSPPAPDRAAHPARQVGRVTTAPPPKPGDSGVKHEPITRPIARYFAPHEINEYKA
jgi:hypothetical protein